MALDEMDPFSGFATFLISKTEMPRPVMKRSKKYLQNYKLSWNK